ncbi:MAG: CehA/McbA family metallohydrolase [Myxococcota bacterium]|nr:CehA/McbA family metallohydrolase [Myxococcota bacterium]MDW8361189.1 CehA/McbA family metallohydrolase [Myxococcales bacterium]
MAIAAGCDDEGPHRDASAPTDAAPDGPPPCIPDFRIEPGDPDGHPEPLGATLGEARAGRIEGAELPDDPDGLAVWKPGDFVLSNGRIAVLVEDARPSDLYDPYGGKLVGLGLVESGRIVRPADFSEAIIGIGRFTVEPTSVTVTRDGRGGGPAVVRVIGRLSPIPFIDDFARSLVPGDFGGMQLAVDYVLEPERDHFEIRYAFANERNRPVHVQLPLHFFMQSSRMPGFWPGRGFAGAGEESSAWIAFVEDGAASYAWASPDGPLTLLLEMSGASVYTAGPFTLPACALTERPMARVYVGGPGVDGLRVARARSEGETLRPISGIVRDGSGMPASGVRVHAVGADGSYVTRSEPTDETGRYILHVPMEPVDLYAFRRGEPLVGPQRVAVDENRRDLALPPSGFVRVRIRDTAGEPLPARVQLLPRSGWMRPTPAMGEPSPGPDDRLHVAFVTEGEVTLRAFVGTHRLVVSRGYEYELVDEDVHVRAGETASWDATLEHTVQTPGILCGDFHIHTHRSPDSGDHVRDKLRSAAADGLEIPVRSDHEFVADFEPAIAALGLGRHLYGIGSLELTTFTWGHFGVFPLEPVDAMTNDGVFFWPGKLPPEVFAEVRAREGRHGRSTIIINHPRSGGTPGAYFVAAGFDPSTGMVMRRDHWDEQFRLVEVFNDSDFESNLVETRTVVDWFGLLRAGRPVFAVGSSDSHHIRGSPVGYPRTCILLGVDEPEALRAMGAGVVRDAMEAGRHSVSGGVYVDAVARGGIRLGGTLTGAASEELVRVTVQAARWIDVDRLRVFVDGDLVETIALGPELADPGNPVVRFDREVRVPVSPAGSFAVFVADGDMDLSPVHPGRKPFGVTNPIFFRR